MVLKESNKAITKNVDKEDKIQLKNMEINFKVKQQPDTIYINESGLYSLLLSYYNCCIFSITSLTSCSLK